MIDLKKVFMVGLIAVLVFSLSGCKSDDNPVSSEGDLAGTWVLTSVSATVSGLTLTRTPAEVDYNVTVKMKSDKTYQMTIITGGETTNESGTYAVSNGNITFTPSSGSAMTWSYSFSDSKLIAKTTLDLSSMGLLAETPVSFTFTKQ
jgi:hypothetical protein